jgi:hypothetical protein
VNVKEYEEDYCSYICHCYLSGEFRTPYSIEIRAEKYTNCSFKYVLLRLYICSSLSLFVGLLVHVCVLLTVLSVLVCVCSCSMF